MKIGFTAFCLALLLSVTAQAQQQTNGYLGVHALFLSNYSATSRNNLSAVLREPNSPNQVQVVSVPAFYPSGASASGAWSNLNRLIDDVYGAGRTLTVGVALSFHATSTSLSSSADASERVVYRSGVGALAAFYKRNLAAIQAGRVKVIILPSLEDQLSNTDNFVTLARAVVAQLQTELRARSVSGISAVIIRRSPDPNVSRGTATDLTNKCSGIAGTSGLSVSCQYEVHGPTRSNSVWSNDGVFVYGDVSGLLWREDANSAPNSETFANTAKIPLSSFTAQAASNRPVNVLWRPMYNLWTRNVLNGRASYAKPGGSVRSRGDSDGSPAFNEQEKAVLRYFLTRAPR